MKQNIFYLLIVTVIPQIFGISPATQDFEKIRPIIQGQVQPIARGAASATSDVEIYRNPNGELIVRKVVRAYLEHDVFSREVSYLRRLRKLDFVPKILYADYVTHALYMTFAGERLTRQNLPANWEQQIKNIIAGLRNSDVQHNDIKTDELLVLNGKIMVIDYGWASDFGKPINPQWPAALAAEKVPFGFDDKISLVKAIMTIQSGKKPDPNSLRNEVKRIFG